MRARRMRANVLAPLVGINRSTISEYLNGHAQPKIDILADLAATLNVSADWLLGLDCSLQPTPLREVVCENS